MFKIDISKCEELIKVCPNSINLMLVGDSGIGKTTVVENFCKNNGYFLKTLVLSQLDPSEALGVPTVSDREYNGRTYKTMESAVPAWVFELAEHDKALLFLDEFFCGDPATWNSFLNLLSQKVVNGIDLHHVKFVAATNIDMYTFTPGHNILTRFCFFHAVNESYDTNYPFIYTYKDDTNYSGPVFAERRLAPRCATSLKDVPAEYLQMFYEGFTNTKPIMNVFSEGLKYSNDISSVVFGFATKDKDGRFFVKDEMLVALCDTLYKKYPRAYEAVIRSIKILDRDQIDEAMSLHGKKR